VFFSKGNVGYPDILKVTHEGTTNVKRASDDRAPRKGPTTKAMARRIQEK